MKSGIPLTFIFDNKRFRIAFIIILGLITCLIGNGIVRAVASAAGKSKYRQRIITQQQYKPLKEDIQKRAATEQDFPVAVVSNVVASIVRSRNRLIVLPHLVPQAFLPTLSALSRAPPFFLVPALS